jgi:hypothetical protein
MPHINETPPDKAGLLDINSLAGNSIENAPKYEVSQAEIGLLVDDICDTVGCMITQLYVVIAMRDAGDTAGLIYALRRGRPYWKHISESARDLIAADAERLSALRQREADL